MKTFFDCIPCFVRQTLESVRMVTDNEAVHEQTLRGALSLLGEMDLRQSPPAMAQRIHRLIRELTGQDDPYRSIKDRFNRLAMDIYPELEARVRAADDPLSLAVRLAIAGNVIDMGINNHLRDDEVHDAIDHALAAPLDAEIPALEEAISQAVDILYLADNAGEIVFDKLLIGQMPLAKVTVAVRGGPIINDVTIQDARDVGITEMVEVIDNGSDAPGTILSDCSEAFRQRFDSADLVIAKGQGNYETLNEAGREMFFILKAKCPVIARDLGCEIGSLVLRRARCAQQAL